MQSVQGYAQAFGKHYGVPFVDEHVLGIVEDILSSKFLASNSTGPYIRCITVGKMTINYQGVLVFLRNLGRDAPVAKIVGITHRDDTSFYIPSEEDILLII